MFCAIEVSEADKLRPLKIGLAYHAAFIMF